MCRENLRETVSTSVRFHANDGCGCSSFVLLAAAAAAPAASKLAKDLMAESILGCSFRSVSRIRSISSRLVVEEDDELLPVGVLRLLPLELRDDILLFPIRGGQVAGVVVPHVVRRNGMNEASLF